MPQTISDDEALFLVTLREVLPILKHQDDQRLVKRIGIEKFQNYSSDLSGFIATGTDRNLVRNERIALGRQLLKCVESNMKAIGIPITLTSFIDHMSMLQHSVEQNYPGYYEAKLLRYTIMQIEK